MSPTINIGPHPRLYNDALLALGVTSVAVEQGPNGRLQAQVKGDGATGQLVGAILNAHVRLIAAESHVATVNRAIATLEGMRGRGVSVDEVDDTLDALRLTQRALANISRVTK